MRVFLIYNPTAGDSDHDAHELLAALRRGGDAVDLISSKADRLHDSVRSSDAELFVAAGGDGTVAKVVRAVAGRADVSVLIVPTGTANNIAGSLFIDRPETDLRIIRETWTRRPVDVAMIEEEVVVEAAGCGVFAAFMRAETSDDRQGLTKEAKSMAEYARSWPLFDYRIAIDGEERSGEALMIEAMVLCQLGPNLVFAPEADPGDGWLDVVVAGEEQRAELIRYLKTGGRRRVPSLPVQRARSVTIDCGAPWHHDDEPVGPHARTITVRAAAWHALMPRPRVR